MAALSTGGHQVVKVWHPDAVGEILSTDNGSMRVEVGDARYQLSTGEVFGF